MKKRPIYCSQNEGDCSSCSLTSCGLDCSNRPIEKQTTKEEIKGKGSKAMYQKGLPKIIRDFDEAITKDLDTPENETFNTVKSMDAEDDIETGGEV